MNISFIVPCYNCENYISNNILKLNNKLKNLISKYEIILVDDFSNDGTLLNLKKIKKKIRKVKVLKKKKNYGKAHSVIEGIKKSKYSHIIFIDSDLPYFEKIPKLIKNLKKNDMVIINRKEKKSKIINKSYKFYQLIRILLGYGINYFLRLRFNLKVGDTQAGLKGFVKPKNFIKIKFISKRFFFDLELILLFLHLKKKIISLPTRYSINEKSTIKLLDFKSNLEILKELIKISIKYKSINE